MHTQNKTPLVLFIRAYACLYLHIYAYTGWLDKLIHGKSEWSSGCCAVTHQARCRCEPRYKRMHVCMYV